jgi:hypothetical protein
MNCVKMRLLNNQSIYSLKQISFCTFFGFFMLFILMVSSRVNAQVTYVVNSIGDQEDIDLADKTCADQFGNCTLRAAIQNANKTGTKDRIIFNLDGNGPFIFEPKKNLPKILNPLEIDGTSQAGYSFEQIQIVISGKHLKSDIEFTLDIKRWAFGLQLMENSSGSMIKGLGLISIYGEAIRIYSDHNMIQSNFIGYLPGKLDHESNKNLSGITIFNGNSNLVGGNGNQRNIISGNVGTAINMEGNKNQIIGNFLGTDIFGKNANGNDSGIYMIGNASSNVIYDNLISGNRRFGISYGANSKNRKNFFFKNKIGTDSQGLCAIPNKVGFYIFNGYGQMIGYENMGNLISGNDIGLMISSS